MKIKDIFKIGVDAGIKNDPRKDRVSLVLEENKKIFEKEENKEYFNQASLWNPYVDSGILYGDEELEIRSIAVGIDIEAQEMVLIDRLKEKGRSIDLVIGHHPEGIGLIELYKMVKIQEDILFNAGVNVSSAEKIISEPFTKYSRTLMGINYNRAVDSARLLNIPFMTLHTPADNMVHTFLEKTMKDKNPYRLADIIKILLEIEEYKIAAKNQNGPKIISGTDTSRAGNIYIDVTGGLEASEKIYEKLETSGVGTIVGMHMSEEHLEKAKKHNINVIMAGHMSSDTLGVNLILDEIESVEKFENIVDLSGFKRIRRRA